MSKRKLEAVSQVSNDGANGIQEPYVVEVTIEGTADLLFHRWSNEAVLAYLRQYARENGDHAAMLNAADTIVKLRRELDKLAEHVPHEPGMDVVDATIRRIKELEAQTAKAGEIAEIIARLKRECERQCDAEGPDADVVACSICATSKTISALEALEKGEN